MKYYFLVLFLFILLGSQYLWYRAQAKLTSAEKTYDNHLSSRIDLLALSLLLAGYLAIYFYTFKITLYIYLFVAIVAGLIVEIFYYRNLRKKKIARSYLLPAIIYSSVMYLTTVIMGLFLLLIWY